MIYYTIENKADKGEIIINGVIGDYWSDSNNAKQFLEDFRDLEEEYDDIDIRILNSPGGSISEGKAIFSTIRNSEANTTIYVDSMAASMAFYIMMAADRRFMEKRSRALSHKGRGGVIGNSDDLRTIADELDLFEDEVIDLMHEITGKQKKWLKDNYFTNTDKYITAQEALKLGLINGIFDKGEILNEDLANIKQMGLYNYYDSKLKYTEMENQKILNEAAGIKSDASESELHIKIVELKSKNDALLKENEKLIAEKTELETKHKNLEEDSKSFKSERAKTLIENAIQQGKIICKDNEKQIKITEAEENYDLVKNLIDSIPVKDKKFSFKDLLKDSEGKSNVELKAILASEWDKLVKISGALLKLKTENPERYQELYNAKFK